MSSVFSQFTWTKRNKTDRQTEHPQSTCISLLKYKVGVFGIIMSSEKYHSMNAVEEAQLVDLRIHTAAGEQAVNTWIIIISQKLMGSLLARLWKENVGKKHFIRWPHYQNNWKTRKFSFILNTCYSVGKLPKSIVCVYSKSFELVHSDSLTVRFSQFASSPSCQSVNRHFQFEIVFSPCINHSKMG